MQGRSWLLGLSKKAAGGGSAVLG
uniref:Uncharacterized protein n=1 Tax=Arundo donax TaxID=35708 RepID=A0A0A9EMR9_ARUDO